MFDIVLYLLILSSWITILVIFNSNLKAEEEWRVWIFPSLFVASKKHFKTEKGFRVYWAHWLFWLVMLVLFILKVKGVL